MTTRGDRRKRIGLLAAFLIIGGLVFHEQIIGTVAYAVEKGQLKADEQHLAKIEAISEAFRVVAKRVKPAVVHITTMATPEDPSYLETSLGLGSAPISLISPCSGSFVRVSSR